MKPIKGKNDPTTFSSLSPKIGGQVVNNKPKASQYLTEHVRHVYKKTESSGIINTDVLHQEIEQERQLNRIDDTNRDQSLQRIDS